MSKSIFDDIKYFIVSGNMINKLIVVNLLFSIVLVLLNLVLGGNVNIYNYFLLSSNLKSDLFHPWVIITHLFVSTDIFSLIWDMLVLYWFGNILGDMLGDKRILPAYVIGGLIGAVVFLLASVFMKNFSLISGVETSVIAIVVSSAVLVPDYEVRLPFFGRVKLKVLVSIYVGLQVLYFISSGQNKYFSIVGGIIFGWFYIYSIRGGRSLDSTFNNIVNYLKSLFTSSRGRRRNDLTVKSKAKNYKNRKAIKNEKFQEELDRILDKIRDLGYDNLSEEEKMFLFTASKRQ